MHPETAGILARLVEGQRAVLGDGLIGTYVFGSAVVGHYLPGISDVDTVAVLIRDPTPEQLLGLDRLHRQLVESEPAWHDRVEALYLSAQALTGFRSGTAPAARTSPGEPFHAIEVDETWLIDWYQLRRVGVALYGPPAASLVPSIAHEEWVDAVRRHLLDPGWLGRLETPGDRAYAVLTMSRGLRTVRTGEHVSKDEGARWAADLLPDQAALIDDALRYRAAPSETTSADEPDDARAFVLTIQRLVA